MEIQHKGAGKTFENPILERLSKTHIAIPILLIMFYGLGLLYWSMASLELEHMAIPGLFFSGLLFFTLVEYCMHRFLFHMNTSTKFREDIQYKIHQVNHEYPKDKYRLAMPPILSIAISTILLFGLKLFIGDFVFAFLPGLLFGYTGYLFVYFIIHAYPPPKNVFKQWWVFHSLHHYKSQKKAFGVTSPLWDFVFRTMP
jgi:sterol desaturase/sphingolipid hydroxylase (fatty acid hydroxylase superfamily)